MASGQEKVASLIEGSTSASTHSCRSPHAANGQSAQQQQHYTGSSSQEWGALEFANDFPIGPS